MAADLLDTVALFTAVNSDPAKAQRLAELGAVLQQIKDEREALEARAREIDAASEMAARTLREAQAAQQDVSHREAALQSGTAGLASAITSHNAENQRFEQVRQQVEADHTAREARIAGVEQQQTAQREDLNAREQSVAAREAEVKSSAVLLARRHKALADAMALP